jgi:hypothetical protein
MRGITGGSTNFLGSSVLVRDDLQGYFSANHLQKVSVDWFEGKGGVWTELVTEGFSIALGCAHFNSKNAKAREDNAVKMIKGVVGKGDLSHGHNPNGKSQ